MLVKNIYIRVAANFAVAAINFIPIILIIRFFGSEIWGKVVYYYSIAGVLSIFSDLGTLTGYNKFLAAEDSYRDIAAFFVIRMVLVLLYVIIFFTVFFLKFYGSGLDKGLLNVVFLAIMFELVGQFFTATMTGKRDFIYLSVVEIISAAVFFVYVVLVCFFKRDIYLLAYSKSILPVVTIICGLIYFKDRGLFRFYLPKLEDFKKYASYSLPIGFASICEGLTSHLDKLVLGSLLGVSEVGFYQVAQRCYGIVDRFVKPVTTTMFTEIAHRISKSESFFHKQFKDLVETLNFLGGLVVIMLIFASGDVVRILFGAENLRAAFILQFLSLATMGRLFWRPYNNVIYAIEKHKLISFLNPLNIFVMLVCYYLLIPLKVEGSFYLGAAALPIAEFVAWLVPAGFLRIYIIKKQFGNTHMWGVILKIWLPLAAVISVVFFINNILMLPLVILVFILIEYYLNIINGKRLQQLIAPLREIATFERVSEVDQS